MAKTKGKGAFSHLTDGEIIAKYKETRDQIWVAELFQRYSGLILGTSFKILKNQDEIQDAAGDIYEELTVKLLLHDVSYFPSWLHTLIKNHCLMKLRKNNPFSKVEIDEEKIEAEFMETPSFEHLSDGQPGEMTQLAKAIAQLEEKQRVCIEMFHLAEKSYKEIAEATGWDLKQVKSYIQNGMRNLKNFFNVQGSPS